VTGSERPVAALRPVDSAHNNQEQGDRNVSWVELKVAMAFAAGTHFGTYQVTGLIGVGGMGEVYRATDTTLGSEVASDDRETRFEADARNCLPANANEDHNGNCL
jgi:hypothetical protein